MRTQLTDQVRYMENSFNNSMENLVKHKTIVSDKQTQHANIIEYITEIEGYNQRSGASIFLKSGWYLHQTIMDSLCLNLTTFYTVGNVNSLRFPFSFQIWYLDFEYSLKFEIRSRGEADYLSFLCRINNQLVSNRMNECARRFKLRDFLRIFYILEDNGGKSIHNTNQVFSVTTHEMIGSYAVLDSYPSHIWVEQQYKDYAVDYKHGHLLHFRENLDFFSKPIYPTSMGFNLNYYDFFKL